MVKMVSQSPLVDEVMQDIINMIVFTFVNSKTVRNKKVNGKIITIARFTLHDIFISAKTYEHSKRFQFEFMHSIKKIYIIF